MTFAQMLREVADECGKFDEQTMRLAESMVGDVIQEEIQPGMELFYKALAKKIMKEVWAQPVEEVQKFLNKTLERN